MQTRWVWAAVLAVGCSSDPAPMSDAGATDAPVTDTVTSDVGPTPVLRMCEVVHACGYTTAFFGIPADRCTDTALETLAARAEVDSPEQRVKYARMQQCAATARTCDEFVSCVEYATACTGSATPMCRGNVAVRCSTPGSNYLPRVFDCSTVGQTCEAGACVLAAGPDECTNLGEGSCEGNVRLWCRPRAGGGRGVVREPCPSGSTCIASNNPTCQPIAPCTTEGGRCDGDTAVLCAQRPINGTRMMLETRSNCASVGRRCQLDGRGVPSCEPRATACTIPARNTVSEARCDGNAISVCLEGNTVRIDCTAWGRSRCMQFMPPAGLGSPYPICVP